MLEKVPKLSFFILGIVFGLIIVLQGIKNSELFRGTDLENIFSMFLVSRNIFIMPYLGDIISGIIVVSACLWGIYNIFKKSKN